MRDPAALEGPGHESTVPTASAVKPDPPPLEAERAKRPKPTPTTRRETMRMTIGWTRAGAVAGILLLGSGTGLAQSFVYTQKDQTPQRQAQDQAECQAWATQQSGINPGMAPPAPPAQPPPSPLAPGRRPLRRTRAVSSAGAREAQPWARWAARLLATRARARLSVRPAAP